MTVEEARKIIGKKASKYSDEQIRDTINTLTVLADLAIDSAIEKHKKSRRENIDLKGKTTA